MGEQESGVTGVYEYGGACEGQEEEYDGE